MINCENPFVSILTVPDVYNEAKKLMIGQELLVEVIEQVESLDSNKSRYLVESKTTKVVLDCETYDQEALKPGEELSAEVLWHIKGRRETITVVPVGKRQKMIDLPTWMTKKRSDGSYRPSCYKYHIWRYIDGLPRIDNREDTLDQRLCHLYNDAYGIYGQDARNSYPEKQLEVAAKWEKQNRYKSEINAALAIMAVLLLNKHKTTQRDAYKLMQNIGRRALRSMHIEVLYELWLRVENNRFRTDGLWQRFRQIESAKHLQNPLQENSPEVLRQFYNVVAMRRERELLPIASSISAAIGELDNLAEIESHAFVTLKLVDLCRTLPPKSNLSELQDSHTAKLQEILRLIDSTRRDITLLEPLNYKPDYYAKDLDEYDLFDELFFHGQTEPDWQSRTLQQIDHLDDLLESCIAIQERVSRLKANFQNIYQLLGE